jgi:TonB-linked SusC/RagA family outer membrane protein
MKILYLRCLMLIFLAGISIQAYSQNTISGTVTDKLGAVIGVNVIVEGTTTGTSTDMDGKYSLSAAPGQTIRFSMIGYNSQSVKLSNQTIIDITLIEDSKQLNEVVVTALGVKREKKSLGYALQEVQGEKLTEARENNLANALTGKVAGLQIVRSSNGPAASSKIVLRGNNSLTGDNQPLIVVDGIPLDNFTGASNNDYWNPSTDRGNGMGDINPDDIESMSVLKGASAAALYGSRAGNGVILITTKSGKSQKGLGITYSNTVGLETIFTTPKLQDSFGQGTDGIYNNRGTLSWGPKIAGQSVSNWDSTNVNMRPYDNIGNFYNTGVSVNQSLSFQQQIKSTSVYTSITHLNDKSKIPGSKLNRTNLLARAVSKFGAGDKWTIDSKIQYINSNVQNRPLSGVNTSNSFNTLYLFPRSLDIRGFEDAVNPATGNMLWYGAGNQINPYWNYQYNTNQDVRDRFLLNGSLKYAFTDWLNAEVKAGSDLYTTNTEATLYAGSPIAANGRFSTGKETFQETNYSALVSARKDGIFGKFGAGASVGGNLMSQQRSWINGSSGELEVPNLFSLNNGKNRPTVDEGLYRKKINSLYGTVQLSYDNYFFVDGTLRNDWSSSLSKENRSFLYPSVSTSLVVTDMIGANNGTVPDWITYGKLRASYAQVGNDLPAYQLYNTYSINKDPNGNTTAGRNNVLFDKNVKSELITSVEVGAEARFFKNRLGFDVAWYKSNATRQLINIPMDPMSGYSSKKINAGDIQNQGVELMMDARIIQNEELSWTLSLNYSKNNNTIKALTSQDSLYTLGGFDNLKVLAVAGQKYGDIWGTKFRTVTDASSPYYGKRIVSSDGLPLATSDIYNLGNQQATGLLGITNAFAWKGLNFSFLVDARFGGKIFSGTNQAMQLAGTAAATAVGGNRDMMVVDAVVASANGEYAVNTKEVTPERYWSTVAGTGNLGIIEANIYDASNVRLRNVQLSYNLPGKILAKTPFQKIKVGVSCNNVWMISSHLNGVDPESVFATGTNAVGFENVSPPTSRSVLFNLSLGF